MSGTNSRQVRREFIRKAALSGLAALSIPAIVSSALAEPKQKKLKLKHDAVILFQGDSITDAGRSREEQGYNNSRALGAGYAFLAASDLLLQHPAKNLKFYNKGVSGNKVHQLADRWEEDCLALQPDVLSILIGVNDYWHTLDNAYEGTVETYTSDLVKLLDRTKSQLPNTKLIIGEPFAVPGIKAVTPKWYPAFLDYQKASRQIAAQFGASFIPYQQIFDKAQKLAPGTYWTNDGVHTTLAGAELMAQAWLQTVKG